jgi:ADP-ribose pyrophosphatase YjhB (NUDIX family)
MLVLRPEGGRPRPMCPADGCGFTHYGEASIGTGAVVFRDDRVLLIERRMPGRSFWQIPGGYVEIDEPIGEGVEREVLEETGVVARAVDVVGFRHAPGLQLERPVANIYVVFRLVAESGEPVPDGEESFDARFFAREELAVLPGLTAMSLWAIEKAAAAGEARGLLREHPEHETLRRPGHTLFGLALDS